MIVIRANGKMESSHGGIVAGGTASCTEGVVSALIPCCLAIVRSFIEAAFVIQDYGGRGGMLSKHEYGAGM